MDANIAATALRIALEGEIDYREIVLRLLVTHPHLVIDVVTRPITAEDGHWMEKVRNASYEGKVPAIKVLRKATGCGLLEAKKWVETDEECIKGFESARRTRIYEFHERRDTGLCD